MKESRSLPNADPQLVRWWRNAFMITGSAATIGTFGSAFLGVWAPHGIWQERFWVNSLVCLILAIAAFLGMGFASEELQVARKDAREAESHELRLREYNMRQLEMQAERAKNGLPERDQSWMPR